jgi:hypothetical protein
MPFGSELPCNYVLNFRLPFRASGVMNRDAMRENGIRRFAKHYAIPTRLAREVCAAGGNWAKAFDLLVARMKQITQQENRN